MTMPDDRDGVLLLNELRHRDLATAPPPCYDIGAAMRRGDTIVRRHRLLGALAAILTVAAATAVPIALTTKARTGVPAIGPATGAPCSVTTITPPIATYNYWVDLRIDPTGRYMVGSLTDGPTGVASTQDKLHGASLLYDNDTGAFTRIPGADTVAAAVNASGDVIGAGAQFGTHAWVYRNGRKTDLPLPSGMAGGRADPMAINSHGDIVGNVMAGASDPSVYAVRWPADRPGTVEVLGSDSSYAYTITDDGTVYGMEYGADGGQPYAWTAPHTGHVVAVPDPHRRNGSIYAVGGRYAIGRITGSFNGLDGGVNAMWNLSTGTLTAYPAGYYLVATTIDGVAVGNDDTTKTAFLVRDGVVRSLPRDAPLDFETAEGMTLDGRKIVGIGEGSNVGIVWRC
ncbi:MAG TPA: hypothetical protein VKB69_00490 [Micromonosporaceae bacterium]|nr:hypothetical protein [Micromonosporaceae bacterium]